MGLRLPFKRKTADKTTDFNAETQRCKEEAESLRQNDSALIILPGSFLLSSPGLCFGIVQIVRKPRGFLARAWSRSVWSAGHPPALVWRGSLESGGMPRTPDASRGSVAALSRWIFALTIPTKFK